MTHKLMRGNFFDDRILDRLLGGRQPTLIYSDPPWDQGKITYFYRIAKLSGPQPSIFDMIHRYGTICDRYASQCFIEMGKRHLAYTVKTLKAFDFDLKVFPALYNSGHNSNYIIYGAKHPSPIFDLDENFFMPLRTVNIVKQAILLTTQEGDAVLDFCLGKGTTLKACAETGRRCLGLELSKERLEHGVRYVEKKKLEYKVLNADGLA